MGRNNPLAKGMEASNTSNGPSDIIPVAPLHRGPTPFLHVPFQPNWGRLGRSTATEGGGRRAEGGEGKQLFAGDRGHRAAQAGHSRAFERTGATVYK